jgi:hypothetical protein
MQEQSWVTCQLLLFSQLLLFTSRLRIFEAEFQRMTKHEFGLLLVTILSRQRESYLRPKYLVHQIVCIHLQRAFPTVVQLEK